MIYNTKDVAWALRPSIIISYFEEISEEAWVPSFSERHSQFQSFWSLTSGFSVASEPRVSKSLGTIPLSCIFEMIVHLDHYLAHFDPIYRTDDWLPVTTWDYNSIVATGPSDRVVWIELIGKWKSIDERLMTDRKHICLWNHVVRSFIVALYKCSEPSSGLDGVIFLII